METGGISAGCTTEHAQYWLTFVQTVCTCVSYCGWLNTVSRLPLYQGIQIYRALHVCCPEERVNRQWLSSA